MREVHRTQPFALRERSAAPDYDGTEQNRTAHGSQKGERRASHSGYRSNSIADSFEQLESLAWRDTRILRSDFQTDCYHGLLDIEKLETMLFVR